MPVTWLVELPPLAVTNITLLVKPPTEVGANFTTTLVEPNAGTLNVLPDRIENGAMAEAVPLLTAVPPELVTTNVVWALVPVAIALKL